MGVANHTESSPKTKSAFVTVMAWFCIVIFGFMAFGLLIQNILLSIFDVFSKLDQAIASPELAGLSSAAIMFVFKHLQPFLLSALVFSIAMFGISIGLLRRNNPARILFIIALGLTAASNWLMPFYAEAFRSPQMDRRFNLIFIIITAGVITGLHGWIIYKLVSANIRREFLKSI
ncbi:MAG: hypothetical protein V1701_09815 [Planctomycetota bacterium]